MLTQMNKDQLTQNGFIKKELVLFKKQYNEKPVPKIQDDRNLAIAWVCYYFKDSIANGN